MKPNAPFLKIFSTLPENQINQFGSFLETPLSVPYRQPILLFSYLQTKKKIWFPILHKNRNHLEKAFIENRQLQNCFSKQNISQSLFPGQNYNDSRIRRIVFLTKQALEKFLTIQAVFEENSHTSTQTALLKLFLKKGHFACLDSYGEKFQKNCNKKCPSDEPEHSLFRFRKALAQSEAAMRSQNLKGTRFQEANDFLDKFYFQQKTKLYAAMHVLEPMAPPEKYTFHREQEMIMYLEESDHLGSQLIEMYTIAIRLEKDQVSSEDFPNILAKLLDYSNQFSPYDFRQLTGFFLNFLDKFKFEDGNGIRRQIFSLLIMLLDRKAIYIQGGIAIPWFNRVVFSALHLNELEWLEGFLLAHEGKIVGEHSQDVWELSMLRYTFELGAFAKVLSQLKAYHFTNPKFAIWARIIKIKALTEVAIISSEEKDAFERSEDVFKALSATKAFIKTRKGIHETHREFSLSLLSKIHRLANLLFLEKGDMELLKEELEIMRHSPFEKRWIQKKLSDLK